MKHAKLYSDLLQLGLKQRIFDSSQFLVEREKRERETWGGGEKERERVSVSAITRAQRVTKQPL